LVGLAWHFRFRFPPWGRLPKPFRPPTSEMTGPRAFELLAGA
jgi:hypothetical protein